tara:strand:+ start:155 stop:493 length:339 start_codon:yes stop_codon:yes gene_type:complete
MICLTLSFIEVLGHKKTVPGHLYPMTLETVVFVWLLFAFGVQLSIFLFEFFDTAGGVNQFLLTGEKWVACGADFHSHIAHGTSHLELVSTCAGYCTERIFRMNPSFHFIPLI